LPFSAGRDEIINFFDDPSLELPALSMDKVLLATAPDGRVTGQAFVEFESSEQVESALKKDREMMGTRYIEVFVSSEDERARYLPLGEDGG
jgi:heterogeneous nuclear ribonucleoprotein F/H